MGNLGLITYDFPHLKTTEILERTSDKFSHIYLIPFKQRSKRKVLINHRPEQFQGPHIRELALFYKLKIHTIDKLFDKKFDDHPKKLIVGGAGILEDEIVSNYEIINCHPGLIPMTRGLDSFKWAIFNKQMIGITIHKIDGNVDKGEAIHHSITPIFKHDDINILAARHYRNEINALCDYINGDIKLNIIFDLVETESRMRMPFEKESKLKDLFLSYKNNYKNS